MDIVSYMKPQYKTICNGFYSGGGFTNDAKSENGVHNEIQSHF